MSLAAHHLDSCSLFQNRIVIGAINGQLQSAFTKIGTLHAKNNFTFAIVSGDLFSEDDDAVTDLLNGKITIPLPTYFTIGLNPFPQRVIDKLSTDEDVSNTSLC